MSENQHTHDGITRIPCMDEDCAREFLTDAAMEEHAAAVHTFDDIRRTVNDALRDTYGRRGNHSASPVVPSIYIYVVDQASDWVVFERKGDGSDLWRCSYSITDGVVTLGEATRVTRRTVYDPVGNGEVLAKNEGTQ